MQPNRIDREALIDLATDPGTRRVIGAMMEEARAVGEALGVTFTVNEHIIQADIAMHPSALVHHLEHYTPNSQDRQSFGRLGHAPSVTSTSVFQMAGIDGASSKGVQSSLKTMR